MKIRLGTVVLSAVLGSATANAQNSFELVGPLSPPIVTLDEIPAVTQGATAMADIDNDGDQDILLSGYSVTYQMISRLYVNNGAGGYTLKPSSFVKISDGSIDFADFDGDNDMDVLITGLGNGYVANLYQNDGLGNFTLDTNTPFQGVIYSSAAIADVNGDNAPDVLIFGNTSPGTNSSNLYLNDGTGAFTLAAGTPFEAVAYGKAAFADTDGDADKDLVITGLNISNAASTTYYVNNGSGVFTPAMTNLVSVHRGTINFGDLDGDNDNDVLITGNTGSNVTAQFYKNNGIGAFTLVNGTPFDAVHQGSVAFGDTDGDGDTDILLTGGGNSSLIARLYNNNGTGTFTTVAGTLFQGVAMGNAFLTDIDGDNDNDAFLIGGAGNFPAASFYTNDAGVFTPLINSPFTGVKESCSAFADIDGDNDQDVLISGKDAGGNTVARLYTNNGNGDYTIVPGTPFEGVTKGAVGFSDVDSDGDLDVLITGYHVNHSTASLYTNNGSGMFTYVPGTPFTPTQMGSLAFSDIDLDGDEDVLLTGYNGSYQTVASLYSNTGGTFSLVTGTPFTGVANSNCEFADFNDDGDADLIITGFTGSNTPLTQRFTNNGSGVFTAESISPLIGIAMGSMNVGDVDGDNDLDLFLSGYDNSYNTAMKIYTNDGTGAFTELSSGVTNFSAENSSDFADMDGDGDLDLLMAGYLSGAAAKLYSNNGAGIFTEVSNTPFIGAREGSVSIADIDGDGKQDVLITGMATNDLISAFLYRNTNCTPTTGIAMHEACNSFQWIDGVTYTSSTSTPTWTLTNAEGCDSIVTLHLTIQDLLPPVADSSSLDDVITSCAVAALAAPTATDNCAGSIQGTTTQVFPITDEGTTIVTWTYDDGNGHTVTQTQQVTISYDVAPVPVDAVLADVTAECTVNALVAPLAAENCTGTLITATTNQVFPITDQDTTIVTWTYEDVNGNTFTQTQRVILADTGVPVPDLNMLPDIIANCSHNLNDAIPTATDACAGSIIATTADDEIVSAVGTTVVTWTYDDGNGNITTQSQNIIITDTDAPVADAAVLPAVSGLCSVAQVGAPTATDGCIGQISGTTTQVFPITAVGTTVIVWTFDDGNGNTSTQTQDVVVTAVDAATTLSASNVITAVNANATYQWINCNGNTAIAGETGQTFTPVSNGSYAVMVTENGCTETSECVSITTVGLNELAENTSLQIYPNPNNGLFTIDAAQATVIEIRNAGGQLIHTQVLNAGKTTIELNAVKSGVYFITAAQESYTVYRVSVLR